MRRDLIIGASSAFLLITGAALAGEWLRSRPRPPPQQPLQVPEIMVMPKLEPIPPDIVDDSEPQPTHEDSAPPTQPDVPPAQPESIFTQPVEPPPPVVIDTRAIRVPPYLGSPRGPEMWNSDTLDQKPAATFQPQPIYPPDLRRNGITGSVTVRFIVDSQGRVIDASVVESAEHEFDENCLQAMLRWKFRPGKRSGRPVSFRAEETFRFTLDPGS
jgi:protein TonB